MTADGDARYQSGVLFIVNADSQTVYQTPQLRVSGGGLTTNGLAVPWLYGGDTFIFGSGPRFPIASFSNVNSVLRPTLNLDLQGSLGEVRLTERNSNSVALFGSDGKLLSRQVRNPVTLDIFNKGRYSVEVTNDATQWPDVPVETKVTMNIDSTRSDYIPPTLTTLFVLDGNGRLTRELVPRGLASLYFSAADYGYTPGKVYQPVRSNSTQVSYRYEGTTAWTQLPVTEMSEDTGAESRLGGGVLYRVDLSSVANVNWARVDLKIDLADNAGNTTAVVMQPAFAVGSDFPARRRASGR